MPGRIQMEYYITPNKSAKYDSSASSKCWREYGQIYGNVTHTVYFADVK